jgi:tetratricopeptide (TPR) repeat protein
MSSKPNKLVQFWQELKRRKVFSVIAMYAGAAYIIIELVNNVSEPLHLPAWTATLVILLLIIGFPIVAILSWIFDITPSGVKKTESKEEIMEQELPLESGRRKLRVSDVIISVLIVVIGILVYPKIFGSKSKVDRDPDGRISVAVMPFQNLSGDTLFNVWQDGIQNLLITSLSNSNELSVRQFETMYNIVGRDKLINYSSFTPTYASEIATKLQANTVIIGNVHKSGNIVRITANLLDSGSEEIYKSYEIEGDSENDFFNITDSLSSLIKNYLEIKQLDESMFFDLKNVLTKSTEAYKYYIHGYTFHGALDYTTAIEYYNRALNIDSNFVSPMIKLSYVYGDIGQSELSKKWANRAYSKINNVPIDIQLSIKEIKAAIDKRPLDQINYMKDYLKINPYCMNKLYAIGWASFNTEQYENAIEAFERNVDIYKKFDKKSWIWTYILLGKAYHEVGDHKKEKKIYELGLELWPNAKLRIVHLEAICALSQGDTTTANEYLAEFRSIGEQNNWSESNILYWFGGAYDQVGDFEQAEKIYRRALAINPQNFDLMNDLASLLISNNINIAEGMELAKRALKNNPENGNYLYTYGLGLYKQDKLIEAQESLSRAWYLIPYYDHEIFLSMKDLEKALANQIN